MIKNLIKENETLRELLLGTSVFYVPVLLILLIFTKQKWFYIAGLTAGYLVSMFMAVHMAYTLEIGVTFSEKDATAYFRRKTMLRYGVVCILVAVIGLTECASPITAIVGIMGIKIGAYLQPITHKVVSKKNHTDGKEVNHE